MTTLVLVLVPIIMLCMVVGATLLVAKQHSARTYVIVRPSMRLRTVQKQEKDSARRHATQCVHWHTEEANHA